MFKHKTLIGIFVMLLFVCGLSSADSTCDDKKAVVKVVEQLLSLIEKPDCKIPDEILAPGSMSFAVEKKADGSKVTRRCLQCLVEDLMGVRDKLKETMGTHPKVMIDGDLAVVWASYQFIFEGKPSHHGTNAVSLIKIDGKWKIASIVYNKIEN